MRYVSSKQRESESGTRICLVFFRSCSFVIVGDGFTILVVLIMQEYIIPIKSRRCFKLSVLSIKNGGKQNLAGLTYCCL